jgi:hypothetical protein
MFKLNPFGKKSISVDELVKDWTEKKPLPLGRTEFEAWSSRIIAAANIGADPRSQRFALADMITHLGPTEDHKDDAYFIKTLRKVAVNQVALAIMGELKAQQKAELEAKAAAEQAKTPSTPEATSGTDAKPQA